MNLHDNQSLFAAAVQFASRSKEDGGLGIKPIFIEKDYWICRSLKYLSDSEVSGKAVFKGGTSISKAYGLGGRFSEDIDIAITKDESRTENQTKNLIHSIFKTMSQGLVELPKPQTRKFSKYRKVFYSYPSIADGSVGPTSITPGQILLEIVSFANPYPYHKKQIKSFVTEYLEQSGRLDIIEEYGLEAFEINVLDPERTATEKIVSLLRYSLADDYISELRAKIRHFYDLHFLWNDETIRVFLQSDKFRSEFKTLIESDQARFNEPLGWQSKSFSESPMLTSFDDIWEQLKSTYLRELPDLAYQNIPSEQEIKQSFIELSSQLF